MKRWIGRIAAVVLVPTAVEVAKPGMVTETLPVAVDSFVRAIAAMG